MAFPKSKNGSDGKDEQFGNSKPADENSNKGPSSGSQVIGVVKGRLTFSKSNISDLNTGVCPVRGDD